MSSAGATTIAAIASPPGPGRRGVIRLSGPRAAAIARAAWAGEAPELGERAIVAGRLFDGRGEQPLVCLWMPGPRSLTGEDVAELHLPGSPPLLAAALARVLALGAEQAGPGEFTRRAFANGRIDLTQAEGVLAVVSARSEAELRAARALLFGGLAARVEALRERLADARALAEASLDFDELDTGHVPAEELEREARAALDELARALSWEEQRGAARGEPRAVLAGAPNAGKSLLFNALTGSLALVSEAPGTTRDALVAAWELAGSSCRLVDTAGIEGATDGTRGAAQGVAGAQREAADLILWVVDATRGDDAALARERRALPAGTPCVLVWNKIDLIRARRAPPEELAGLPWVATSALERRGADALATAAARALGLAEGEAAAAPHGAGGDAQRELSLRHRRALAAAAAELERALAELDRGAPLDLFAAGLAAATAELDAITGRTTAEDVLGRIFARFCIGK